MTIVYSVLIMAAVGAGLGALLSYLGKLFNVERDPKIDDVVKNLAGVNCGGCGFPGCDEFAAALVRGEASVDSCNPTSRTKKREINKILGNEGDAAEETVAVVNCNGGNNAENKYTYQGYGNCRTSQVLAEGSKFCPVGCMGLCDCAVSCGYNAININANDGYAMVSDRACTSCGACVSACPKKLITRIPRSAKYYVACSNHAAGAEVRSYCKTGCIGCGLCTKACNYGAITKIDNLAVIDYKKCVNCGACFKACPTKVIKEKD